MVLCAVFGCQNRSDRGRGQEEKENRSNVSFHLVPQEKERRAKWLRLIRRGDLAPLRNGKVHVCSVHFTEDSFTTNSHFKKLKGDAFPSIFPSFPSYLQVVKKPIRRKLPFPQEAPPKKKVVSENREHVSSPQLPLNPPPPTFTSTPFPHLRLNSLSNFQNRQNISSNSSISTSSLSSAVNTSISSPASSVSSLNFESLIADPPIFSTSITIDSATEVLIEDTPPLPIPVDCLIEVIDTPSPSFNSSVQTGTQGEEPNQSYFPPTSDSGISVEPPEADTPRKVLLKKVISREKSKNNMLRKKVRTLQQGRRRDKKKIGDMKKVLATLNRTKLIADEQLEALKHSADFTEEFVERQLDKIKGQKTKRKFGAALRIFACNLHYCSAKAYSYIRRKFKKVLPHPRTLTKWFAHINGNPGFTQEAINALKAKVEASETPIYGALVMDEMHIRQHVDRDYEGYVDIGTGVDPETKTLATQSLVFLVTGINGSWKLPVGYFLINSLTSDQKVNLLTKCLLLLHETGAKIVSLTMDGMVSNLTTVKKLGCSFNVDDMKTWFPNPACPDEKIYVLFDPCHMLKLVRNTFADWKIFYSESGAPIKWEFVEKLHKLQQTEGLRLANHISARHIYYRRQKMKVRLAAELLSRSTAKALEVCKQLNIDGFEGCEETINFISKIDRLFDILNSKSRYAAGSKKAICDDNDDEIFSFFSEMEPYIKHLRLNQFGTPCTLIESQRKTGFLGLLVCMSSFRGLYDTLCRSENATLSYLPTYKFSQDHLELFFGLIRMRGGWNNNPSAKQFKQAYKRCLVHMELKNDASGNCVPIESISILHCSSVNANPETAINMSSDEVLDLGDFNLGPFDAEVVDHFYNLDPTELTEFTKNVVAYISGFIVRRLCTSLKCDTCKEALTDCPITCHRLLIDVKDQGGLVVPGVDVVKVAQRCEKICRAVIFNEGSDFLPAKYTVLRLTNEVLRQYLTPDNNDSVFLQLNSHIFDQEPMFNHRYYLIKSIATRYFDVRLHHIVRELVKNTESQRQRLNNLVQFKGQ